MKKRIGIFVLLNVLFLSVFQLHADKITLAWDANNPSPDGYRLFMRINDGAYDYDSPVVFERFPNGNIASDLTTIQVPGLEGVPYNKTKYYFVLRAFLGTDESGDSNEVMHPVDRTAPNTVVDLTGSYSRDDKNISLHFTQHDYEKVSYWTVYFSEVSGGPYTEFESVHNTGTANNTITRPFTYVSEGDAKIIYFVIVAFRDSDVHSADSNEIDVYVDRRELVIPQQLRIVISVPVE
jgi:hypothetical protein